MTAREQEEYTALRATIRERGTARIWVFSAGLLGWAALTLAVLTLALPPVATLVPLLALAATYEAIYALHVSVERIGRYLQVAHDDNWEEWAGRFGRPRGGAGIDPLFTVPFLLAAALTPMPLLGAAPVVQEMTAVLAGVIAFVSRVLWTRALARRQREVDANRFQQLKRG